MIYRDYLKRPLDLFVSLLLILLLSPIIISIAIILIISNKGTPFFIQKRPGRDGKIFKIIKFKTMTDKKDSKGILLNDAMRITFLGNLIRKSSLDELPQLFNVLLGQMSLIGPRPLLEEYLPLYNEFQFSRHKVRPGVTGWAQVNGRNSITWNQKFEKDIWYVNNISFLLDVKIFFLSIKKIFNTKQVNTGKEVTMEKFLGNQ